MWDGLLNNFTQVVSGTRIAVSEVKLQLFLASHSDLVLFSFWQTILVPSRNVGWESLRHSRWQEMLKYEYTTESMSITSSTLLHSTAPVANWL